MEGQSLGRIPPTPYFNEALFSSGPVVVDLCGRHAIRDQRACGVAADPGPCITLAISSGPSRTRNYQEVKATWPSSSTQADDEEEDTYKHTPEETHTAMYRLLSGLHAHLTRKEEFNVIILGLDHAGKTTMLEKVKTIFSPSQPGLSPSQITPTIGQNIGRITMSSTYLKFWDLGGSKDIRTIWEKYYEEADAICWVLDSQDRFRNGWKSDSQQGQSQSQSSYPHPTGDVSAGTDSKGKGKAKATTEPPAGSERGEGWAELQKVLQHPSIAHSNIPVLIIANKQDRNPRPPTASNSSAPAYDHPTLENTTSTSDADLEDQHHQHLDPMAVEEVKQMFNRLVMESDRSEKARSLGLSEAHVLGVSALNGHGIREAINWLFLRVATKGQSRKTQHMKTQHAMLKQQQQEQHQQQQQRQHQQRSSHPYLQLPSHDHKPAAASLALSRDPPSLKNNFIKLAELAKLNHAHPST
ncbi:hypothetical protein PCANC_18896 [Puccinia coronata f. sp. avenae]|uniref:ADP-ribosylation factor-like protein 3 n=2 Tax=Puccinia coronata f. sp. avenae TaxID=200324 RepID=A0A2N5SNJ3_9BASI|nr:hypothetical protein PCANC_18896 [Puccinia coronata f. sp. avenae]